MLLPPGKNRQWVGVATWEGKLGRCKSIRGFLGWPVPPTRRSENGNRRGNHNQLSKPGSQGGAGGVRGGKKTLIIFAKGLLICWGLATCHRYTGKTSTGTKKEVKVKTDWVEGSGSGFVSGEGNDDTGIKRNYANLDWGKLPERRRKKKGFFLPVPSLQS